MAYVTLARVKAALGIADAADDDLLGLAADAAAEAIDRWCRRSFAVAGASTARSYDAAGDRREYVDVDDIGGAIVSVTSDGVAVAAGTGYSLVPANGVLPTVALRRLAGEKWSEEPGGVVVTAPWGWPATPLTVIEANLLQAVRLFTRRHAPFGVAGSPEIGSELRLLARLDPDVEAMLYPYRRIFGWR